MEEVYLITLQIGDYTVSLETAESDSNKEKITLFATHVWKGSIALSEELLTSHYSHYYKDKAVLEFGAASGLPSITIAKNGARFVCASDYPAADVIATLKRNVTRNQVDSIIGVVDHIWGSDSTPLLAANQNEKYDMIVMAECVWRHDCHIDLLRSIVSCLRNGGRLLMTYSHHVPGCEEADDHFCTMLIEAGFQLEEQKTLMVPHQWNESVVKPLFLCNFIFQSE